MLRPAAFCYSSPVSKPKLRAQLIAALRALPPDERRRASAAICTAVRAHPAWRTARLVCAFLPLPSEPQIALSAVGQPTHELDATSVRSRRRGLWIALVGTASALAVWGWMRPSAVEPGCGIEPATARTSSPVPATPVAMTPAPAVAQPPEPAPVVQTPIVPPLPPEIAVAAPIDEAPVIVPDEDPAADEGDESSDRKSRRQQAQRLLARAQDLSYLDPRRAVELAEQALQAFPTQNGYSLLGVAGCRSGDKKAAIRAYEHLRGPRRAQLASVCAGRGVTLP